MTFINISVIQICIAALQRLRRRTGLTVGGKSIDESKFAHKRKVNGA